MMKRTFLHPVFALLLIFTVLLAACAPASNEPASTPLPSVTPLPTFAFVQPTEPPSVVTVGAATATSVAAVNEALDPVKVERGKGRYEVLECGTCHGMNGEGTENGSALAGTALSEEAFIDWLRTGGTLGNDHLYSTDRLSDSGGRNLYIYILSLSQGS